MIKLWEKYKELILYIFFGGLTTVVNFALYFLFKDFFHLHYLLANAIAWFGSVIFAFFTNKIYVFADSRFSVAKLVRQFTAFAGFRVVSGLLETGILYILVDFVGMSENFVKIPVAILVVVLNYIFSKLFIFKK